MSLTSRNYGTAGQPFEVIFLEKGHQSPRLKLLRENINFWIAYIPAATCMKQSMPLHTNIS
jgi:hypothetical protein